MVRKQLHYMRLIFGILAAVFSLALVSPASAILTLEISDGINTFTVSDNGPGDSSSLTGAIVYINSFGNVVLNVDTGLSKPVIGSATAPELHLDSILASSGPVTLTLRLSDTDFSGAGFASFLGSIGGILNSANGSTVDYTVYRDLSNTLFGTGAGTLVCTTGSLSGSPFSFGGTCGNNILIDSEFSLTLEAAIHHLGEGNSSFNAIVKDAPEPSAMILLGMGLIGVGLWGRCKANKS